jgi:membrane-associated protein
MELIWQLIDFILHIDKHLAEIMQAYGTLTYVILFLIVFCETGLVVTPFLPGDSLLFAAGALATVGGLNVHLLSVLLFIAAVIGDSVNYAIGKYIGPRVFEKKNSRIFKPEYLKKTQYFYDKYGAKTIVIARFVPIVRTFAPFLAGVGTMEYKKFIFYNIFGAFIWIVLFVYAGYFFGNLPIIKNNFTLVILAIIVISILPAVIEIWKERRKSKT